jgi:hypothetical protein
MKPSLYLYRHRRWVSPAVTLLIAVAVVGIMALPYLYQQQKYEQGMASLVPRIERMQGLVTAGTDIGMRQQAYAQALNLLAYPPQQDAETMQNELSTRLRQAVDGSGLTLSSLAPMPAKPQEGLDGYPVALNVQGNLVQLQTLLHGLGQPPRLWVDTLTVRPARPVGDATQTMSAEILVIAYRRGRI